MSPSVFSIVYMLRLLTGKLIKDYHSIFVFLTYKLIFIGLFLMHLTQIQIVSA